MNGGSGDVAHARTRHGQEKLEAILATAREIACLEGLERLTMRRLASAIGISKSGLYAHFGSKEQLQLATIERFEKAFEDSVLRGETEPPESGLGALLERWLVCFEREVFVGGCFVIVDMVEFAGRQGPVRDALVAAVDQQIAALKEATERSRRTGELAAETDAGQATFELYSILMTSNALFQAKHDPAVFDRARAAIHRLVGQLDASSPVRR